MILHHGDSQAILATEWNSIAPGFPSPSLVYLDPPFCTQRDWTTTSGEVAFSDRFASLEAYVQAIGELCSLAWGHIENGSLVLHVDPSVSHYLKVELDQRLGRRSFASEIVWRYRRWPTKQRNFQRVHDVLLRYTKGNAPWNQLYEPLSASTVKTHGTGTRRHVWIGEGRRKQVSASPEPSPGCSMGDVWDLSILAPASKERTGYPTQKPEALLRRLIEATTDPGDTVLDPCCGSGTTLAAALSLGRKAVGIDRSAVAIRMALERLGIRLPESA